jgi:hypothetical protein
VASTDDPGRPIRVRVPLIAINRVMLSPWLPKTVADQVKNIIKSINGCKTLKFYKSSLVENEGWKKLAENGICHL